jgi:protein SCO1/2
VLFVTVDPQRDIPAKLTEYMPFFDEKFLGLTGTPEEIETAAREYGAYYRRLPLPGRPDDYTMDHSTYTYLIDREGRLRVMYDLRKLRDTDDIVRDIRHLQQSS